MQTFQIERELPPPYLQGIGQICFEWALQEHALAVITYYLLNVGPKHGRVAVRNPRVEDQIIMIKQLMTLEEVSVPDFNLDALLQDLRYLKSTRDMVAHGIWFKTQDNQYMVRDTSGTWKPNPKGEKVSKRIMPQGIVVPESSLQDLVGFIRKATKATELFGRTLRSALDPLREKRLQRTDPDHPPEDQTDTTQ